ncbi:MAG TPA: hypothetical protein DDW62_08735 [Marinilabiliaceae bacterium]|nr:hypothetical protein [Marinilabiliaceae bacterium]
MTLKELKEKANAGHELTPEEKEVLQKVKSNPYYLLDDYEIPEADLMPEEEYAAKYEQNLLNNLEAWGNGFKKEA